MDNFLLTPTPINDFVKLLVESMRSVIKEELRRELAKDEQEKLLTTAELCQLLKVSKPTIGSWEKKGLLTKLTIGNRCFYRHADVMNSLKTLKRYKTIVGKEPPS